VVGEKLQEALGSPDDSSPAPAVAALGPADNTVAIVNALKETLAPVLSVVLAKLANGATLPDTSLPPLPGGKGGSDPKGDPN
jgi:hypothetical protein